MMMVMIMVVMVMIMVVIMVVIICDINDNLLHNDNITISLSNRC